MKNVLAALITIAAVLPANAGWRNTNWGDSAERVLKSDPAVAAFKGEPFTKDAGQIKATMNLDGKLFSASVEFYFIPAGLTQVLVSPKVQSPLFIQDLLVTSYGPPTTIIPAAGGRCGAPTLYWRDDAHNNLIQFTPSVECGGNNIIYMPLFTREQTGL